jgi:hypothetical protein
MCRTMRTMVVKVPVAASCQWRYPVITVGPRVLFRRGTQGPRDEQKKKSLEDLPWRLAHRGRSSFFAFSPLQNSVTFCNTLIDCVLLATHTHTRTHAHTHTRTHTHTHTRTHTHPKHTHQAHTHTHTHAHTHTHTHRHTPSTHTH